MQRREAKNRPERPQGSPETERAERYPRKSPQKRPVLSRPGNLQFEGTGWWCAQSDANPSPKQYQGKIQGENQAWPENATAVCHFTPLLCGVPVKNPGTGNGIFGCRDWGPKINLRDRKGPRRPKRGERYRRKSPQKRPFLSRPENLRFGGTGWWARQGSNL